MHSLKDTFSSWFSKDVPDEEQLEKADIADDIYFRHEGFCPICDSDVVFESTNAWFRDNLRCSGCNSIPRERVFVRVLKSMYPNFRELRLHESSPGGRDTTKMLQRECANYSFSHYFPHVQLGEDDPDTGFRCENLEQLTFADNTFDVFLTQDILEHVMDPEAAFREIGRVLKPGGAHIFTAPLQNRFKPSERRASLLDNGEIHHLKDPKYHGNPVNRAEGSLVVMDWGYDIASFIQEASGLTTIIIQIDDIDMGIRAELIEVIVSKKAGSVAN